MKTPDSRNDKENEEGGEDRVRTSARLRKKNAGEEDDNGDIQIETARAKRTRTTTKRNDINRNSPEIAESRRIGEKRRVEEFVVQKVVIDEPIDEEMSTEFVRTPYEGYFEQFARGSKGRKGGSTSNNTLAKLQPLEFRRFLDLRPKMSGGIDGTHASRRNSLWNRYIQFGFSQWFFELSKGFNLLFYGCGSKRKLINQFVQSCLKDDGPVIVINGFLQGEHVREVLSSILRDIVGQKETMMGQPARQIKAIRGYFEEPKRLFSHVYIVVHNLDGPSLRNSKAQELLSKLASIPAVRFVASIDHIHAPMLWDSEVSWRFHFAWHDATTLEPYTDEFAVFKHPMLVGADEGANENGANVRGKSGALHVLWSVTEQARKLFILLANTQLEQTPSFDTKTAGRNGRTPRGSKKVRQLRRARRSGDPSDSNDDSSDESASEDDESEVEVDEDGASGQKRQHDDDEVDFGMGREDLYEKCCERYIISNKVTFKTTLTEFTDHHLVSTKRSENKGDLLYIPLDPKVIRMVLDEIEGTTS